jgi:hypothetical protein
MARTRKSKVKALAAAERAEVEGEVGAERIIASAEEHGRRSDPDHEVGDLQDAVRALWAALSPEQRAGFSRAFWADRDDWGAS